jgi:allantoin racemase
LRLLFLYAGRDSDKKKTPTFFEELNTALRQVSRRDTEIEIWGMSDDIFDMSEALYWYAHSKVVTEMIYKAKKAENQGFDGVIIGCVGSVEAEYALKEILNIPVVGVSESSFLLSLALGASFSVLTYSDKAYAWLYRTIRDYGLEGRCASLKQANIPLDDLLKRDSMDMVYRRILETTKEAIEIDRADVILLASIGFVGLADYLRKNVPAAIVDPVETGVKFAEMLVDLHKSKSVLQSKALTYKPSPNLDKVLG